MLLTKALSDCAQAFLQAIALARVQAEAEAEALRALLAQAEEYAEALDQAETLFLFDVQDELSALPQFTIATCEYARCKDASTQTEYAKRVYEHVQRFR